jgi:hypothetical protein
VKSVDGHGIHGIHGKIFLSFLSMLLSRSIPVLVVSNYSIILAFLSILPLSVDSVDSVAI